MLCLIPISTATFANLVTGMIDYTAQDFTDGGPVHDVIVDVLGKAGFPRSLRALKPGGRYLLVGFSGGLLRQLHGEHAEAARRSMDENPFARLHVRPSQEV